jgi:hypothetical protein
MEKAAGKPAAFFVFVPLASPPALTSTRVGYGCDQLRSAKHNKSSWFDGTVRE